MRNNALIAVGLQRRNAVFVRPSGIAIANVSEVPGETIGLTVSRFFERVCIAGCFDRQFSSRAEEIGARPAESAGEHKDECTRHKDGIGRLRVYSTGI